MLFSKPILKLSTAVESAEYWENLFEHIMNNRIDYQKMFLDNLTDAMVILEYKSERCSNESETADMENMIRHIRYVIDNNEKITDELLQVSYNVSLSRHSKTLKKY